MSFENVSTLANQDPNILVAETMGASGVIVTTRIGVNVTPQDNAVISISGTDDVAKILSISGTTGEALAVLSGGQVTIGSIVPADATTYKLLINGQVCATSVDIPGVSPWCDTGSQACIDVKVGIGLATEPGNNFEVLGSTRLSEDHSTVGEIGQIRFFGCDDGSALQTYGGIAYEVTNMAAGTECGQILFKGAGGEVARITEAGCLGINVASPAAAMETTGGIRIGADNANNVLDVVAGSAPSGDLYWGDDAVVDDSNFLSYGMVSICALGGLTVNGVGDSLAETGDQPVALCNLLNPGNIGTYAVTCLTAQDGLCSNVSIGGVTIVNCDTGSAQAIIRSICAASAGNITASGNADVLCFGVANDFAAIALGTDAMTYSLCHYMGACCICGTTAVCSTGYICSANFSAANGSGVSLLKCNMAANPSISSICMPVVLLCVGSACCFPMCIKCSDGFHPRACCHGAWFHWRGCAGGCLRGMVRCHRWYGSVSKASGSFVIDHPLATDIPSKYDAMHLVHAFSEGPKHGVFYEGKGITENGIATVNLPEYFESLVREDERYVQLTGLTNPAITVKSGPINGEFVVCIAEGDDTEFYWRATAERNDSNVMSDRSTDAEGSLTVERWKPWVAIKDPEEVMNILSTKQVREYIEYEEDRGADEPKKFNAKAKISNIRGFKSTKKESLIRLARKGNQSQHGMRLPSESIFVEDGTVLAFNIRHKVKQIRDPEGNLITLQEMKDKVTDGSAEVQIFKPSVNHDTISSMRVVEW